MTSPHNAPQHVPDRASARRRLLWTAFAVTLLGGTWAGGAQGADRWMSRPSYFSHYVPPQVAAQMPGRVWPQPVPREAYRPAWASGQPGFSASGAIRLNRVQFSAGGSNDATLFYNEQTQYGW